MIIRLVGVENLSWAKDDKTFTSALRIPGNCQISIRKADQDMKEWRKLHVLQLGDGIESLVVITSGTPRVFVRCKLLRRDCINIDRDEIIRPMLGRGADDIALKVLWQYEYRWDFDSISLWD